MAGHYAKPEGLAWDQYLVATRALRRGGFVVNTKRGDPKVSPWVGVAHKALGSCARLWPELGLTPSSRARLTTTPFTPGEDPFAEFDPPSVQKPQ
jgi:P27 family predicted phage terminase small subunit